MGPLLDTLLCTRALDGQRVTRTSFWQADVRAIECVEQCVRCWLHWCRPRLGTGGAREREKYYTYPALRLIQAKSLALPPTPGLLR